MFIVVIGLLNFHPPHFLVESESYSGNASTHLLEAALLAKMFAAVGAAVGIYRNLRWVGSTVSWVS